MTLPKVAPHPHPAGAISVCALGALFFRLLGQGWRVGRPPKSGLAMFYTSPTAHPTTPSNPTTPTPPPTAQRPLTSDLVLSLLVPPMLLTLVGGRLVAHLLQDAGQLSEQLYQGVRLPTLTLPPNQP